MLPPVCRFREISAQRIGSIPVIKVQELTAEDRGGGRGAKSREEKKTEGGREKGVSTQLVMRPLKEGVVSQN